MARAEVFTRYFDESDRDERAHQRFAAKCFAAVLVSVAALQILATLRG